MSSRRSFATRAIPCDVIWIDIHYMDEYKVFTFDPERFPDPDGTNDYLHDLGFKSVWILDPAVKGEPGYAVYDEGVSERHFLRDAEGHEHHESTWPGEAAFPDYTRPETRAWWTRLTREFLERGMDGVWVDLNEPSPILPLGAELPVDLRASRRRRDGAWKPRPIPQRLRPLDGESYRRRDASIPAGAAPLRSFTLELPRRAALCGDLDR